MQKKIFISLFRSAVTVTFQRSRRCSSVVVSNNVKALQLNYFFSTHPPYKMLLETNALIRSVHRLRKVLLQESTDLSPLII